MNKTLLKNFVKIAILALALSVILLTFSSCNLFGSGDVVAPIIDSNSPPRVQRINPDYFNQITNQDEIYYDPDEIMPVRAGESVYFVIDYVNNDNLPINRVVFSDGNNQYDVMERDFNEQSDSDSTIIEFEIPEVAPQTTLTYTIKNIYYRSGSRVIAMNLKSNITTEVVVAPKFKITFDHQNDDPRTGKEKETESSEINYYAILSDFIPDRNDISAPFKDGGWAFRGYYTKPGGPVEGSVRVRGSENYYFWKDVTLYAFYERLYEFDIVPLDEPIPYEENGETLYYEYGAIATDKTNAGYDESNLEVFDTIADDNGVYPIIEIADVAFNNTKQLETLTIGKYVRRIGKNAFDGSNVENVVFNDGCVLEKIDSGAFRGTTELNSFSLPSTVNYIGDRAFQSSGLSGTLYIEPHLTHIGNLAFAGTSLGSVIFRPGVKFKADAVDGENYVEDIDGDLVEADSDYYLGWCVFKDCQSLKTFRTETDDGQENGLEIVTAGMFNILFYSTEESAGLTSVTLAEGLKVIEKGSFYYQKLLANIILPTTLEDLGGDTKVDGANQQFPGTSTKSEYGVFEDCSSLSSVTFRNEASNLKVLGASVFRNTNIRQIDFPSKQFEFYGDGPFQGCVNLSEVYFHFNDPDNIPQPLMYKRPLISLRDDEADLFWSNEPFKVFIEDDNVLDGFRDSLIKGASSYIKRDLPVYSESMILDHEGFRIILEETECILSGSSGWKIGYCFVDSDEVDLTGIEKNIVEISAYAFPRNIKSVTLPTTVSTIAPYAFSGCRSLSNVNYMGDSLVRIGKEAFMNTAITEFKGGKNLKSIENNAFYSATELLWVDLKECEKLETTGESAFERCSSLRYVRLPSSFRTMANAMFRYCVKLEYLVFLKNNPEADMFSKTSLHFSDIPVGMIKRAYVMNTEAVGKYENLKSLPQRIKGIFQHWDIMDHDGEEPTPEKVLLI